MSWRNQRGQSQILLAAGIGVTMTTGAMYLLQYVQQTQKMQIQSNYRAEMRSALDTALKQAAQWYKDESACNPQILNQKLNHTSPTATGLLPSPPPLGTQKRGISITIGGYPYWVQFGKVTRVGRSDQATEVTLEAWTTRLNLRVDQKAVFLDNCAWPCAYVDPTSAGPCLATDPARSDQYHQVESPQTFPRDRTGNFDPGTWVSQGAHNCVAPFKLGALTSSNLIDVSSLILLQNYLRSGDVKTPVPLAPPRTALEPRSCADFNGDGLVNEVDLGILEKYLRGYVHSIPTHY